MWKMEEHREVFILLKDKQGEKCTNIVMGALFGPLLCNVLRGELAIRIPEKRKSGQKSHNYQTVYTDQPATFFDSVDNSDLAPLIGNQAGLLAGVKTRDKRYQLFITEKLEWGSSLKVNDPVMVSLNHLHPNDTGPTPKATAVIQYVGPVKGESGIILGVEIVELHFFGQGTTDGTFQGEHYFTCRDGNGMFVSLDKLSEIACGPKLSQHHSQSVVQAGGKKEGKGREKPRRFKINDRVMAFKGDGTPVRGTVRWMGPYTENKQLFAVAAVGIETDVKITGTDMESCLPAKHHYFTVGKKKSHLFMREEEVILEEDFGVEESKPSKKPVDTAVNPAMNAPHSPNLQQSGKTIAYAGHPQPFPAGLEVGSPIELMQDPSRHGVIRWKGTLPEARGLIAGVELDGPMDGCGDGEWKGYRYFTCLPGRAFFCPITSLRPDSRLPPATQHGGNSSDPWQIALQVQKYQESRGLPIERAVSEAGLLIADLQETGRTLGTGSYGEVVEIQVKGQRCAAKKLHGVFTMRDVPPKEKLAMTERFETECRRVLYLSHPNIIEMIGIHFDPATGLPTLVMELMDTSLCKYLENNSKSSVPLSTKYTILHDVASGLVYLHSLPPPLGPIVHRDLTANNILLALGRGVVAKIADLGQAKIDSKFATRQQQLSKVPGNDDHMPPEAWVDNPEYNASLDVFSFGVVILHTLTHEWPKPLARFKSYTEVRLEVDRRKEYLDQISDSPLKPLVVQCLSQEPGDRSSTSDVFHVLERYNIRHVNPMKMVSAWEEQDQTIAGNQIVKYTGEGRGIQGHQNSCYLDATIFGLFALSDVFDSLFLDHMRSLTSLQSPTAATPIQREVGAMLWKGIVNPLRKNGAVRYESVMRLRNKLEELGKMEGVNTKEKDPEEFLNMLFKHTLRVDPFIHIKRPSGTEPEFFVQLFVELDKSLKVPTIEALLKKMFKVQHISFAEVPSKLLVQVPRYGKEFQAYKRIVPGIKLDPAPLMDGQKSCFNCGEAAPNNCADCKNDYNAGYTVPFCDHCNGLVHKHPTRVGHKSEKMEDFPELELLSVLCIETSHYVCFSRDSEGRWLFSDSMADRVYDQFNIPRGVECTAQLNQWVYEGDQERLMAAGPRELPELVRRFTQDVYMCVYIQPDYGMYG